MSDLPVEQLLARASVLDAEAYGLGEQSFGGRALRAQAAELRLQALGPRPYPVAVCVICFRLTGWTDAAGSCHACALHAALRAARAGGDWGGRAVRLDYGRPQNAAAAPLRARLAARLGRGGGLDHAVVRAWMRHVEPGETGPIEPEPGFELETATRDEVARVDGIGLLVRFASVTQRFAGSDWERLTTTRIARSVVPNPGEFAADLPVLTLVEAWTDYQQAVHGFNAASWGAEAERRERERLVEQAREQARAEQHRVSDLLQE